MGRIFSLSPIPLRANFDFMRYYFLLLVLIGFACSSESSIEGDVYFEKGQFRKAVESYNQYLGANQPTVKTIYNRGRAYEELGELDAALVDFEWVVEKDAKNSNALLSIAKIRYEQQNYEQALLWVAKALELNTNLAQGHFLSARAKHQMGYTKEAMESYGMAIEINRDYGEAYLYRGALKVATGLKRGACEDFVKAKNLRVDGAADALTNYCK